MKTARYLNPNINPVIHTPIRISLGVPKFRIGYEIAGSVELLMPTPQMLSLTDEAVYRKLYFACWTDVESERSWMNYDA